MPYLQYCIPALYILTNFSTMKICSNSIPDWFKQIATNWDDNAYTEPLADEFEVHKMYTFVLGLII